MTRKLFILRGTSDFAPGAFENTAVEHGGIQLGHKGAGFLSSGSYTSPPFSASPFTSMIPSWNANTPPGTTVEIQARLACKGRWSHWFGFGSWSPFIDRASPEPQEDEMARMDCEVLSVLNENTPADTAQVRVNFHSEDSEVSPVVWLLAISVNAVGKEEEEEPIPFREITIPAYSCLVRDPSIAGRMGGATSLTMLMNRWGEDVLPEEVARSVYDAGAGTYENFSYLCAAGGMYGYECFSSYNTLRDLRQEIWYGHAVATRVHYRAPLLSGEETEEGPAEEPAPAETPLPVLTGAHVDSTGHFVVVTGFVERDDEEYVVFHDPMSRNDAEVHREIPLKEFESIYTGISLVLHKGPKGIRKAKPRRIITQMTLENDEIQISLHGETLIPGPFTKELLPRSTLCYTLSGSMAYASNAQRKFYYPRPNEDGAIKFDASTALGRRLTFYRIGPRGATWVAERLIPEPETPIKRKDDNT